MVIQALDVKTAFLHGKLNEEIYMMQPEGFIIKGQESKVYKLEQALYGLKQASLAWNKEAHKSLLELGFSHKESDCEGFIAFADADCATDEIDRKSITGNIIMLAGGPITWDSRKQKTIAQSSTEVEYMAASDCGEQIIWIESLCMELGFNLKPMILK